MCVRTSRRTVTFTCPFSLNGVEGIRPPGTYMIDTDEELIEGLSFPAYRRTATTIELSSGSGTVEIFAINPSELETVLELDVTAAAARSTVSVPVGELLENDDGQPTAQGADRRGDRAHGRM